MDWFAWLSKTGLDPNLVYEYDAVFSQNELDENDIPYFNHEFLQSMGISVAKHRLEILKLARKVKVNNFPRPVSRMVTAINRTRRLISKYLARWVHRQESAMALVPRHDHSTRWRSAMVKRSNRPTVGDKVIRPPPPPLLITNGSPCKLSTSPKFYASWGPLMDEIEREEQEKNESKGDERWSCGVMETKWDKMFENLKPT